MIEDIRKQFHAWYPREGCGIITQQNNRLKWYPCDNIADNEEDFIIDPKQYMGIAKLSHKIIAVVHSHPDSSAYPSPYDRKACDKIKIPYIIYSYPSMYSYKIFPYNNPIDLLDRTYQFGIYDCFEAIRDYYKTVDIDLGLRPPFLDDWWKKDKNYFTEEYINQWGFYKIRDNLRKNDLLVFKMRNSVPDHCGVYLGEGDFYHHALNRISCIEGLYPRWKKWLIEVYRSET